MRASVSLLMTLEFIFIKVNQTKKLLSGALKWDLLSHMIAKNNFVLTFFLLYIVKFLSIELKFGPGPKKPVERPIWY